MRLVDDLFPSLSSLLLPNLELSDTKVYEPSIRARLGTAAHFCDVFDDLFVPYRGTSLIRNRPPPMTTTGPYA